MVAPADLKQSLIDSQSQRRELAAIYSRLPQTHCRSQALCCSLLPEMTLLEALQVLEKISEMPASQRIDLTYRITRYFFLNPIEITACPFLVDRACLIYSDRPFGCRAYGLWSKNYYERLFEQSRQAKMFSQQQWEKLGVTLPKEVVAFTVPYCSSVQLLSHSFISDESLLSAWDNIESLSQTLSPGHHQFKTGYLSDFGFFLAGLFFGIPEALRLKLLIVREIVNTGSSGRVSALKKRCFDLFAGS